MASPTVDAVGNEANAAVDSGTPLSVTVPTGTQGNRLLAFISIQGSTTVVTPPAGFTLIQTLAVAAGQPLIYLYRANDTGQSGSLDWSVNQNDFMTGVIVRISGDDTANYEYATATGISGNPVDSPNINITGGPKDVLYLSVGILNQDDYLGTQPTNYTNAWGVGQTAFVSPNGNYQCGAYRALTSSSSENPGAWSLNAASAWAAWTIAIPEATAANPDVDLSHYRWSDDDNAAHESTTFLGNEDTSINVDVASDLGTGFNLVVKLGNEGAATETDNFRLQYNKNAGGWNDVDGTSTNVRAFNGQDTDGATSAVERLTTTPETYQGSVYSETGLVSTDIVNGQGYEFYYCVEFRTGENADGDSYQFRILEGTNTITQDVTPAVSIIDSSGGFNKPPKPGPNPSTVKVTNLRVWGGDDAYLFNVSLTFKNFVAGDNNKDVIIKEAQTVRLIDSTFSASKLKREP